MTEFKLNEKVDILFKEFSDGECIKWKYKSVYFEEDVKEFIRLILSDLDFLSNPDWREACALIEKRAGKELVE